MAVVKTFFKISGRFVRDEAGSPAIEYSLMGALVAMACVVAFTTLGDSLVNLFSSGSDGAGPALENAAAIAAGS